MILLALLAAAAAPQPARSRPPVTAAPAAAVTTASGLRIQTLKPGTGPKPTLEDAVLVTYEGRLADGKVFDRTEQPVGLLVADLVPGFTEALLLMDKGGTYRIRIPAALGYGAQGAGNGVIPPNAELDFTITLLDVGRPAAAPPAQP
ncbi:MAG TPA: FKBP-type peptidyl-prolyl cis-trans isomerase [Allosphingosinicella sp.]|jgi:FKBP-type peptidyl-prolyl cis-trans isomerase